LDDLHIGFTSLNVQRGNIPKKKDDLISIFHILIFCLKGCLPWFEPVSKPEEDLRSIILIVLTKDSIKVSPSGTNINTNKLSNCSSFKDTSNLQLSHTQIQRKQLEIIAKNLKDESEEEGQAIQLMKPRKALFTNHQKIMIREIKSKTTNQQLTRNLPRKI
jgi:hypothetical protein